MSVSKEALAVVAILAVVMVIGTLIMYSFGLFLDKDDPRTEPHDYSVSGTIGDADFTGIGHSEYVNENSGYITYRFTFDVSDGSNGTRSFEVLFFFYSDDSTPDSRVHTHVGDTTLNGESRELWTYVSDGITYTFYVGEECLIDRVDIDGEGIDLTADILQSS